MAKNPMSLKPSKGKQLVTPPNAVAKETKVPLPATMPIFKQPKLVVPDLPKVKVRKAK